LRNEEQFLFPIVKHVSVCIPTVVDRRSADIFLLILANKKKKGFGKRVE
jgi:hypothetical protein